MFESRNIKNIDCGNSLELFHFRKHNLCFREDIDKKYPKIASLTAIKIAVYCLGELNVIGFR